MTLRVLVKYPNIARRLRFLRDGAHFPLIKVNTCDVKLLIIERHPRFQGASRTVIPKHNPTTCSEDPFVLTITQSGLDIRVDDSTVQRTWGQAIYSQKSRFKI